jgi:hypothetical protein
MAASRARLEALLARVQQRANEPRSPSAAVPPVLEAIQGGASGRSPSEAPEAPASARPQSMIAPSLHAHGSVTQNGVAQNGVAQNGVAAQNAFAQTALPHNELSDEDIEEYDEELIEIIDDAEVIPQAVAVARAIEPAAFGAAVDRRPTAPVRGDAQPRFEQPRFEQPRFEQPRVEPVGPRTAPARLVPEGQRQEALRPEAVAARPVASSDVARVRGQRRELRQSSFVELLDASLKLG